MKSFLAILFVTCWLLSMASSHAQALLSPPFGLKWGDTPEKLFDWAERQKLDVTINLPGHQIDERHIVIKNSKGSLPSHDATSLEARFNKGRLYEVVLNYADPKMSFDLSKLKFTEAKRALTHQHGQLKLSSKKRDTTRDNFTTSATSYHIEPVSGLFLMLSYTEVHDSLRKSRQASFSIIYHNDNVIPKK